MGFTLGKKKQQQVIKLPGLDFSPGRPRFTVEQAIRNQKNGGYNIVQSTSNGDVTMNAAYCWPSAGK